MLDKNNQRDFLGSIRVALIQLLSAGSDRVLFPPAASAFRDEAGVRLDDVAKKEVKIAMQVSSGDAENQKAHKYMHHQGQKRAMRCHFTHLRRRHPRACISPAACASSRLRSRHVCAETSVARQCVECLNWATSH
jgi:hypothetical protein